MTMGELIEIKRGCSRRNIYIAKSFHYHEKERLFSLIFHHHEKGVFMKAEEHKTITEKYLEVAQKKEEEMKKEKDKLNRKALMIVAAQNYYYAGIEAIEYRLSKLQTPQHSPTHNDRQKNVNNNLEAFTPRMVELNNTIDKDRRNIAYRGSNGKNFLTMKALGEEAKKIIRNG